MSILEELLNAQTFTEAEGLLERISKDKAVVQMLLERYQTASSVEAMWGIIEALKRSGDARSSKVFKEIMKTYPKDHLLYVAAEEANLELFPSEKKTAKKLVQLSSDDWTTVLTALQSLGAEGNEQIIPDIIKVKGKWQKKEILNQIEVTILHIKDGVAGLVREYRNPSSRFSKTAILASLSQKPYKEAIDINVELLYSSNHNDHLGAIMSINQFYPDSVIPRLKEIILSDSKFLCRSFAISALAKVAKPVDTENITFLTSFHENGRWKSKWQPWKWIYETSLKDEALAAIKSIQRKKS